jgi:hypothetical protein
MSAAQRAVRPQSGAARSTGGCARALNGFAYARARYYKPPIEWLLF